MTNKKNAKPVKKTANKTKKPEKKNISPETQPKVDLGKLMPAQMAGIAPIEAKAAIIKLNNGQELIALASTVKDHCDGFARDVNAKEKDSVMARYIMESFYAENELMMQGRSAAELIVVYYPMSIMYGATVDPKKQLGSLFLQPLISPSMSSAQIFMIPKDQILMIFEPAPQMKNYFANAMSRLIAVIASMMTQDAMNMISPESELGKLMKRLQNNSPNQKQEDQEDEYIADVLAKSREPLKPEGGETNEQSGKTPASTEEKPIPSVTVAGVKKTLH